MSKLCDARWGVSITKSKKCNAKAADNMINTELVWAVGSVLVAYDVRRSRNGGHAAACIAAPVTGLPARGEGGECQALRKLRLPPNASHGLAIIDPLPNSFIALRPILVEARNVELVEMIRRRRGWDRRHETRDNAADASFFLGFSQGCCLQHSI